LHASCKSTYFISYLLLLFAYLCNHLPGSQIVRYRSNMTDLTNIEYFVRSVVQKARPFRFQMYSNLHRLHSLTVKTIKQKHEQVISQALNGYSNILILPLRKSSVQHVKGSWTLRLLSYLLSWKLTTSLKYRCNLLYHFLIFLVSWFFSSQFQNWKYHICDKIWTFFTNIKMVVCCCLFTYLCNHLPGKSNWSI